MKKLLGILGGLLCFLTTASAQNPGTGAYPFASFDSKGFDAINLGNMNVRFSIPIVSRTGRGLPLQYALQYEGLVWTPVTSGSSQMWSPDPTWGFRGTLNGTVLAGYLTYTTTPRGCPRPPRYSGYVPPATIYRNYTYHEATGAAHVFDYTVDTGCPLTDDDGSVSGTGNARDDSGFSLYNDATQVKGRGGVIITPAYSAAGGQSVALTDSNGNQITSNGAGVYTDTLGVAALTLGSTANTTTVSYPVALQADYATTAMATIYYVTKTVRTNFGVSVTSIVDYPSTNVSLVDHVTLADGVTTYSFTYEPTVGATDGAVTGRLASVTLPNGGIISYAYPGCISNDGMNVDGTPCLLTRTADGATKSYYHNAPSNGTFTNWTIDESNNRTDFSFMVGTDGKYYELSRVVTPANGSTPTGPDLEERNTYYNSDWNRSQALTLIASVDVTEAQNGNRLSHTTATYDVSSGLTTGFLTRDLNDALLRATAYTYDGSGNLTDLLTTDGSNQMVSHTSYGYDETGVTATSNVPQHTSPAGARGNQTSTHQWLDGSTSINSTAAYYDTGALLSSTSPSGTTTYSYDATQAFVTGTSLPTPSSGVALSTSASYDASSASILSATGFNAGQTVQVQQYDRLQRPLAVALPDGGSRNFAYGPGYANVSSKVTASASGGGTTYYDGYGRTRRTSVANGLNWYVTDTCYGPTGAIQYVSVPYMSVASAPDPAGTHCSSSTANQYSYDALGRLTGVTHPDGTASATSYLIYGHFSTVSQDESGVFRVVDTDALGRTVIACNVTSATQANGESPGQCYTGQGATGFPATYAYNDAAHTTTVTQGVQTRVFQTDALGRTVYTSEPERGVTTYTYTYQGPELLVSRNRPAPNQTNPNVQVTTRTRYDTMGRPTIIDYLTYGTNTSIQPSRYFWYDVASNGFYPSGNAKGLLAEAHLMTGDSNDSGTRFTYDIMGRIAGMYQCAPGWCSSPAARGMYRAYGYDFAGNNTTESWTYGYIPNSPQPAVTMTRTYTVAGELASMYGGLSDSTASNFPSFYQVNPSDQTPFGPAVETLGNGLTRNGVFDANGQDAGKFVCSGTTQPDCANGTYVYGYRVSSVGGKSTQIADTSLNRISDMQYDDFGRLKGISSNDGFNMAWTYDRYGNRYSQTGGGGGMSVPQPQFSFDTTTNRITGYSYDAAGNLVNDGLHSYSYDLDGNMVYVDGGSTAHNYIDALNRRVAQSTSSHFERYEYNAQGSVSDVWWDEEQYEHISRYTVNGKTLAFWESPTGHVHFQHPDYLGTVRFVTTSTGIGESAYRSLPFGESYNFLGPDTDRSHFAGLERDLESDTHHAQFRQYSSTQGRWLSPDPFGGSYDITDPQSFNRYTYVLNRPLSATDPSGLVNCLANPEELDPAEATYCEENPLADCYDGECSPGPPIVQQPTQPGCGQGIQSCVSAEPLPDFPNGTVPGGPRSGQPASGTGGGTATGGGSSSPNAPINPGQQKTIQQCLTQTLNSDGNGVAITLDLAGDIGLFAPGAQPAVALLNTAIATASVANSAIHTDTRGAMAGLGGIQASAVAPAAEYSLKAGSGFLRALPVVGGLISAYATFHDGRNIYQATKACHGGHW